MNAILSKKDGQEIKQLELFDTNHKPVKKNKTAISVNTFRNYNNQLEYFNKWLRDNNEIVSPENVLKYFNYLQNPGRGNSAKLPGSINLAKSAIKRKLKDMAGTNPALLWGTEKVFEQVQTGTKIKAIGPDDIFTIEQIKKLVNESEPATGALIEMLYHGAVRVNELITATLKNCKVNGNTKITVIGKGNKQREIAIPADTYKRINKFWPGKPGQKKIYLFENYRGGKLDQGGIFRRLQKACQTVLFPDLSLRKQPISAHKFRHSQATHLLKFQGWTLKAVSLYLGHANIQTTAEYYDHSVIDLDQMLSKSIQMLRDPAPILATGRHPEPAEEKPLLDYLDKTEKPSFPFYTRPDGTKTLIRPKK